MTKLTCEGFHSSKKLSDSNIIASHHEKDDIIRTKHEIPHPVLK